MIMIIRFAILSATIFIIFIMILWWPVEIEVLCARNICNCIIGIISQYPLAI